MLGEIKNKNKKQIKKKGELQKKEKMAVRKKEEGNGDEGERRRSNQKQTDMEKTKKELGVKWERKYKIMSFKKITKIQLVIVIKGIY